MLLEEYIWFHGDATGSKTWKSSPSNPWEAEVVAEVRYVAYGVIAPIILSVGIPGNLSVIFLLRLPQFKGVVFSYFTALAVADLLSLLLCISPLHHVLAGATLHYSTAVWYSYFELLFVGVAMSTSVLIVVSITVHRFFSVCRPTEFKRLNTPRCAWICMAAAFGTSVVAWFPMSFLRAPRKAGECQTSSFTPPDNRTWWVACLMHDTSNKGYFIAYVWIRQVLVTFLPIIAVVWLNLLTLRGFMRHRRVRRDLLNRPAASGQPSVMSSSQEEKNLMGLLIAVITSFVITIVPSGIANAVNSSTNTNELTFIIFSAVANNLEILNHTLNFYLYVLCSKPVRETLLEYYNKHRGNIARRLRGSSSARKVRSETSDDRGGGGMRDLVIPMSKSLNPKHSQQVYSISSTSLPSRFPHGNDDGYGYGKGHCYGNGMDSSLAPEENKPNKILQENLFAHVIKATPGNTDTRSGGRENPNFEFMF